MSFQVPEIDSLVENLHEVVNGLKRKIESKKEKNKRS